MKKYTEQDLKTAFNDGRLLDEKDFDAWLEKRFPNDKANKIREIKRILEKCYDGSTTTCDLEADSSPCISSTGTNKMNVSVLVERFGTNDVGIFTYNNETEIAEDDAPYEDLEEDVIDEILSLLEQGEVEYDKFLESCQD